MNTYCMSDNKSKTTAKKAGDDAAKKAVKAAKKVTDEVAMRELREAKDLKAWRVAQLAAQMASNSQLFQTHVPDSQMDRADGRLLDGWFHSLIIRANWLLDESPKIFRVEFNTFFIPGKRCNYTQMAKMFEGANVGSPWHRSDTMKKRLLEIEGIFVSYYAEGIAEYYIRSEQLDDSVLRQERESYKQVVIKLLSEHQGDWESLAKAVMACVPKQFDVDESILTSSSVWGCGGAEFNYSVSSELSSNPGSVFRNIMYYRDSVGVPELAKPKGLQGGRQEPKQIYAYGLFTSIKYAGLDAKYWSFRPYDVL
jgi:hypothetical protein